MNAEPNNEDDSVKPVAYDAYQELADQYTARIETKPHNAYYDRPATVSLWPDSFDRLDVLDAGCGPGVYSELLANRGANVTAIDVSDRMLEHAKHRAHDKGYDVEVMKVDLSKPLADFANASFNFINAPLCLDYIEDWRAVFREFARILRPEGSIVFSCEHPMHTAKYYKTNEYFSVEQVNATWSGFGKPIEMTSFRRSFEEVLMPPIEAGLSIDRVLEPLPTEDFRKSDLKRYLRLIHRPAFLHVRATK